MQRHIQDARHPKWMRIHLIYPAAGNGAVPLTVAGGVGRRDQASVLTRGRVFVFLVAVLLLDLVAPVPIVVLVVEFIELEVIHRIAAPSSSEGCAGGAED